MAEISGGVNFLPRMSTLTAPRPADDLVGDQLLLARPTSLRRRPMNRLIEKIVFSGFVIAWCLAG